MFFNDAQSLCAGPATNGACPNDVGERLWVDQSCGDECYFSDLQVFLAATSESCAYCLFTSDNIIDCYESPWNNLTCSNAVGLAPAYYCWEEEMGCDSALENLTDSCANCIGNENEITSEWNKVLER